MIVLLVPGLTVATGVGIHDNSVVSDFQARNHHSKRLACSASTHRRVICVYTRSDTRSEDSSSKFALLWRFHDCVSVVHALSSLLSSFFSTPPSSRCAFSFSSSKIRVLTNIDIDEIVPHAGCTLSNLSEQVIGHVNSLLISLIPLVRICRYFTSPQV